MNKTNANANAEFSARNGWLEIDNTYALHCRACALVHAGATSISAKVRELMIDGILEARKDGSPVRVTNAAISLMLESWDVWCADQLTYGGACAGV